MEQFVTRYLVQIDEYRWLMYTDKEDCEEADTILEIKMPAEMANMLDLVQSNYWHMQGYFEAQWNLMLKMFAENGVGPGEPVDGDQNLFSEAFEEIVKRNGLDELGKDTE